MSEKRAHELAEFLLLGEGFDTEMYSDEDLDQYNRLKAEQYQMQQGNKILGPTGEFTPEWNTNWHAFEKLRNRYKGMPPRQLNQQQVQQPPQQGAPPRQPIQAPATPGPKYSFYPTFGGDTGA